MPIGNGSGRDIRFMNTCGNRYCQEKLGFESGRVIEIGASGVATVECIHSTPPKTGNSCEGVVSASPLVQSVPTSVTEVARECVDAAVPNMNDSFPNVNTMRFVDTCGKRFCQNHNFRTGRVVEYFNDAATVECYQDPANFWVDYQAPMQAVAQNCIDTAAPRLQDNGPDVNMSRFMSTCGDRYCREVLGQRSGKVVEFINGVATLTCVSSK